MSVPIVGSLLFNGGGTSKDTATGAIDDTDDARDGMNAGGDAVKSDSDLKSSTKRIPRSGSGGLDSSGTKIVVGVS